MSCVENTFNTFGSDITKLYGCKVNYYLKNKIGCPAFTTWWKPRRVFGRIEMELTAFTCSRILWTLPRFLTVYGGTENMLYFFYKIIFSPNKKKVDIRSTVNHIRLTSISCFIALYTCRPIKIYVLSELFYKFYSFTPTLNSK